MLVSHACQSKQLHLNYLHQHQQQATATATAANPAMPAASAPCCCFRPSQRHEAARVLVIGLQVCAYALLLSTCCFSWKPAAAAAPSQASVRWPAADTQGTGKSLLVHQLQAAAAAWQEQQSRGRFALRSAAVVPLPLPAAAAPPPKLMPTIGTELHKCPMGFTIRCERAVLPEAAAGSSNTCHYCWPHQNIAI